VVVVPDTFLWGSRRFPLEDMPERVRDEANGMLKTYPRDPAIPAEIDEYNTNTGFHEHWIARYANLLGTSLAGVVSREDRIAFNYLLSRPDVLRSAPAAWALGGGNRAALLNATHDGVRAAVIVGLMSTYAGCSTIICRTPGCSSPTTGRATGLAGPGGLPRAFAAAGAV